MIAEAGLAALWLAAGLAGFQFLLMIMALRSAVDVTRTMRAVGVVQGVLTLVAFSMLLLVFARSDMSVALVFANSNSAKPFIYKVAGAWGNHEADFGRGPRQPVRAGAGLLCIPPTGLESVRPPVSGADGRTGAQSPAA